MEPLNPAEESNAEPEAVQSEVVTSRADHGLAWIDRPAAGWTIEPHPSRALAPPRLAALPAAGESTSFTEYALAAAQPSPFVSLRDYATPTTDPLLSFEPGGTAVTAPVFLPADSEEFEPAAVAAPGPMHAAPETVVEPGSGSSRLLGPSVTDSSTQPFTPENSAGVSFVGTGPDDAASGAQTLISPVAPDGVVQPVASFAGEFAPTSPLSPLSLLSAVDAAPAEYALTDSDVQWEDPAGSAGGARPSQQPALDEHGDEASGLPSLAVSDRVALPDVFGTVPRDEQAASPSWWAPSTDAAVEVGRGVEVTDPATAWSGSGSSGAASASDATWVPATPIGSPDMARGVWPTDAAERTAHTPEWVAGTETDEADPDAGARRSLSTVVLGALLIVAIGAAAWFFLVGRGSDGDPVLPPTSVTVASDPAVTVQPTVPPEGATLATVATPATVTTPATEAPPVTEVTPVTEATPATEAPPVTEVTPVTEATPATEAPPVTEVTPVTEATEPAIVELEELGTVAVV